MCLVKPHLSWTRERELSLSLPSPAFFFTFFFSLFLCPPPHSQVQPPLRLYLLRTSRDAVCGNLCQAPGEGGWGGIGGRTTTRTGGWGWARMWAGRRCGRGARRQAPWGQVERPAGIGWRRRVALPACHAQG